MSVDFITSKHGTTGKIDLIVWERKISVVLRFILYMIYVTLAHCQDLGGSSQRGKHTSCHVFFFVHQTLSRDGLGSVFLPEM